MGTIRVVLIAMLAAPVVALGACGGGDSGVSGASTITTGEASASGAATTPASASGDGAATPAAASPEASAARVKAGSTKVIATGLEVPWDIAFLPSGDALVTERMSGKILTIPAGGGKPTTLMTVPGVVPEGEGGLLGLAVSPDYATNHLIYAYFSAASDNRIAKIDTQTKSVTTIFTGIRKGQIHNGGQLAFGPDGMLYVGVGETGDTGLAQDKSKVNGKILRLTPNGKVPSGNPFKSPVWTYGHRNVQGFAWDKSGRMWASEFGQDTTDEVNLIKKGHDYGWPIVEGKGSTQGGKFTNPLVTWTPTSTSSPSGAAIVGNTLYVGALAGKKLWKIPIHGASLGKPVGLLSGKYGRIRAVTAAPNGTVWISTSNRDGRGAPVSSDDRIIQVGV